MVGSVGLIGAGAASAHGSHEHSDSVSISCEQDLGDNTVTNQIGGTANIADALNGGDADASANQQLCGLNNEDAENTADGTATGGAGGVLGDITL